MDDLIAFLRARLDEAERTAREATPGPWRWVNPGGKVKSALVGPGWPYQIVIPSASGDIYPSVYDARHIADHDPARVLLEVEAKRRILDECAYWRDKVEASANAGAIPYPCLPDRWEVVAPILRLLALPYADHPSFEEEWRP